MLVVGQRPDDNGVHHHGLIRQQRPQSLSDQSSFYPYVTDAVAESVLMTMLQQQAHVAPQLDVERLYRMLSAGGAFRLAATAFRPVVAR